MTSQEIIQILIKERHPKGTEAIPIRELRCGCGYGKFVERSIDLWVLQAEAAYGCPAISYEIKVSRADFMRDIKDPQKQRGALAFSNQLYYVAPAGVIPQDKLPPWAGLIEIHPFEPLPPDAKKWETPKKQSRIAVSAMPRDKVAPTWSLVVSLLRRHPLPAPEEVPVTLTQEEPQKRDPAAVYAITKSLMTMLHNLYSAPADIVDEFETEESMLRTCLELADSFETWAFHHVDFDKLLPPVYVYILEDNFGKAWLQMLINSLRCHPEGVGRESRSLMPGTFNLSYASGRERVFRDLAGKILNLPLKD